MNTWQTTNYAQRLTLCESVMPASGSLFGADGHSKAIRPRQWRT